MTYFHKLLNTRLSTGDIYEVIRFAIVGVFATLLHYGIYLLLRQWINYNFAYTIGYGLSFICNFILTSYFTFKTKATVRKGIGFTGVHLFNYLFQMCLLNICIRAGVQQKTAPLIVFMIAIPIQFLLIRYVFKGNNHINNLKNKESL